MKSQIKEPAPESEGMRINEVEETNEIATLALMRTKAVTRRLRLEYAILLERLEERATKLPSGIGGFEEMASPPTPSVLDESLNVNNSAASKNGVSKKGNKKAKLVSTASGESGSSSSVKQKIRDPDMPKRPTNAYLIFCDMEKEKIKKENEEKNPGVVSDLSKSMTEAWKGLDEEDKKPYFKLYVDDKARYEKEMQAYNLKKQKPEETDENILPKGEKLDTETPLDTPEPAETSSHDFDSSIAENDQEDVADEDLDEEQQVDEVAADNDTSEATPVLKDEVEESGTPAANDVSD
ncbi:hypothetical protein DFJ63DRAFT_336453 [Scheffersomyces coipomensis]|uniref:uncharacterized protein n=1 Tax=Scheffersomyces coipomensis TaxID=1788519 RepID=UPI00315D8DF2